MIALTSLSLNRIEHQRHCINTWQLNGFKVISFNSDKEIYPLQEAFNDINFIATSDTLEAIYKRPYVALDVFLNFIRTSKEKCMIINSDIEIYDFPFKVSELMEKGIVIANRCNYDIKRENINIHDVGFDVFFIDKKFVDLYPENTFCLGQCHYDYWIPFRAIMNKIPVYVPTNKFAYHKAHPTANQYALGNWKKTALHLIELENLDYLKNETGCWAMNKKVFSLINANVTKVEI